MPLDATEARIPEVPIAFTRSVTLIVIENEKIEGTAFQIFQFKAKIQLFDYKTFSNFRKLRELSIDC